MTASKKRVASVPEQKTQMNEQKIWKLVEPICKWLKENGRASDGCECYFFETKDEPWMQFVAELQCWKADYSGDGDFDLLWLSYSTIENGDVCFDPLFKFRIEGEQVTRITFENSLIGFCDDNVTDDPYVAEFVRIVWERHMKNRTQSDRDVPPERTSSTANENTQQGVATSTDEIDQRALRAYRRRFGDGAPIPSSVTSHYERDGEQFVELLNVNGSLATYRVVPKEDGGFRLEFCPVDEDAE